MFWLGLGTPLQYSCLENPMDGGAWWAAVHGVSKSWTRQSDFIQKFPGLSGSPRAGRQEGAEVKAISLGMTVWLSLPLSLPSAFLRCLRSPWASSSAHSWRALRDADIVGDTSPWPCDPCLCREPEGSSAGCVPSLAQVFAIFTGASPWPHSPLRCPIQCYWRFPRPPRRFHFHPLPCWLLPFLPKLSVRLCGPGKTSSDIHFYSGKLCFSPQKCRLFLETLEERGNGMLSSLWHRDW